MSKKCCKVDRCESKSTFFGLDNCCCDFSTLIILILIILQFNRRGGLLGPVAPIAPVVHNEDSCEPVASAVAPVNYLGGFNSIDNSILFIIALFFLSCCNPCRRR